MFGEITDLSYELDPLEISTSQELASAEGSACCTEARKEGQSLDTAIVAHVTYPDYPGVFQKFEMR